MVFGGHKLVRNRKRYIKMNLILKGIFMFIHCITRIIRKWDTFYLKATVSRSTRKMSKIH